MEIKFFRPDLPRWTLVENDIKETYEEGILYPGKYTLRLEEMMRQRFDVKYAVTVSNCSDALMLSLCDLPAGAKVIMPSYTFRATYHAAEWNNLRVVLTDVDEWGYLDPESLESCLDEHRDARAVIPVNLWGNVTYVEEIRDICNKYKVRLVYDAAHGISSEYDNRPIGDIGDLCAFSIAVTKPLPCGEGAIVTTNSDHLGKLVEKGRLHGNVYGDLNCTQKGLNAKIGEINSIIAIHGLTSMNQDRDKREDLCQFYMKEMEDLPVRSQKIDSRCVSSRKDFGLWVEDERTRDRLKVFLENSGIGVKSYFFPPVHRFTSFEGILHKVSMSDQLSRTCLNLPCYGSLGEDKRAYVVQKVKEFYSKKY